MQHWCRTAEDNKKRERKEQNACVLMNLLHWLIPKGEVAHERDNELVLLGTSFTHDLCRIGPMEPRQRVDGIAWREHRKLASVID
jgi:hypothetical protein